MAGNISDVDVKNMLDNRYGAVAATVPATYYAALVTTAPTDSTGASLVEVSAGGYARVSITNNTTNFPSATGTGTGNRIKANGTVIQWPTATAGWGNVKGVVLYDASTGGAYRGYYEFASGQDVVSGNAPFIAVGNLTLAA